MTKTDIDRQESADHYPHVVAQLSPKWRIIECRDREQWVLQRKKTSWDARSHCRTSEALRRVVLDHVGDDVELPELPKWLKQPARFKNGVRVDLEATEALSPASTRKPALTPVSSPPGGRLSACGRWRLWGPELSERSLRFATIALKDNVVPPAPIPMRPNLQWERRRHQRDLEQRADRNSAFRSML